MAVGPEAFIGGIFVRPQVEHCNQEIAGLLFLGDVAFVGQHSLTDDPRICKLMTWVTGAANRDRAKLDAWFCKKFAVLVKRKCTRGQVTRSVPFRRLIATLSGQDWFHSLWF